MSGIDIVTRLRQRRRALARAISAVEACRQPDPAWLRELDQPAGRARVLGITGAPGAGKSTLLNACINAYRRRNLSVGVVAVDPSSPLSGGALLGDRIRMDDHAEDDGVFVRSVASRGHLGGTSLTSAKIVSLMESAGFDVIIIETVGTGQSEVEIMNLAPTVILVCAPGLGDEIQAMKAGIMEIATIFVVNKMDLPGAERTRRQLMARSGTATSAQGSAIPVISTIALTGQGIDALLDAIDASPTVPVAQASTPASTGNDHVQHRQLIMDATNRYLHALLSNLPAVDIDALVQAAARGDITHEQAAQRLVQQILDRTDRD